MTSEFTLYDSVAVDAHPEAVWAVLTDFSHQQRWAGGSPVTVLTPPPLSVGSRFHERAKRGLFWANFDLVCTEWEPGRVFAWKARSFGVWGEHRWELRDHEGGTLIWDSERFWGPAPLILVARAIFPLFGVKGIRRRLLESLAARARARADVATSPGGEAP